MEEYSPDLMEEYLLPEGEAMPEDEVEDDQPIMLEALAASGIELSEIIDADKIGQITSTCLESYTRDKEARSDWDQAYDRGMSLVGGERAAKTFPWPNAANVKYPLIQVAAMQFGARAYPAIVNGSDVVKAKTTGNDPEGIKRARGDRVAEHMNYQLLEEMPEWDEDTDRLCHTLPTQGTMFRKVVWDATYSRPSTDLLSGKELVVNPKAKDLESVPCYTIEDMAYPHQIEERQREGRYRVVELAMDGEEEAKEQILLECHCRYDLDEDGYAEPYIAVIHKDTETLLSLRTGFWPNGVVRSEDGKVVRVQRHVEFIKYGFLPNPEGEFYDIGFAQLLGEHTEIINSTINQLLDAATDQNAGGGFIGRGANLKGGNLEFVPGEWKMINAGGQTLRESIVPRPTAQPSPVLFNLLGLMIEAGKEVASIRDVMQGDAPSNQPAATTLAIIEQGMQVFSSIYKRMYRSLTKELALIFQLNGQYLPAEKYFNTLDDPEANVEVDYNLSDYDIRPVADPSITTSAQKITRANFLMQVGGGNPMLDQREIMRRVLEAANIDGIESLMPEPDQQQMMMTQQQMQLELRKAMAEIMETEAGATEDMASARLKEVEAHVKAQEAAIQMAAMRLSAANMMGATSYGSGPMGPMGGLAGPAVNTGVPQGAGAAFGGPQGGIPASPLGTPGASVGQSGPAGVPDQGFGPGGNI